MGWVKDNIPEKKFHKDIHEYAGSYPNVVANLNSTELCYIVQKYSQFRLLPKKT